MKIGKLAKLIKENKPVIGTSAVIRDPAVAIVLSNAGFDWIFIDVEHNPVSELQLQSIIYALKDHEMSALIRVRENTQGNIKLALDMGADGIVVPQLESVDDFKKAIEYAKYPPIGKRGYNPMHATDMWLHKEEYDRSANKNIKLICQIETAEAFHNIDDILKVEGIDGIFIGPSDLSTSLGYFSNPKHPEIQKAINKIIESANKHGITWGMPVSDAKELEHRISQGAKLIVMGSDRGFLQAMAAKTIEEINKVLGR